MLDTTYRRNHLDSKEALSVHVDQLALDQQEELAAVDFHLRTERYEYQEPEVNPRFREFLRAATD
jgi:hypothetical protein